MCFALLLGIGNFQTRTVASKFGYYTHDVRVPYPPKQRSKVWKLPVHRKLVFVTNGHLNDYANRASKEAPKTQRVTAVVFAKSNTFKLINNFTRSEMEFIFDNVSQIRAMFDQQQQLLADQQRQLQVIHNTRYLCR